MRHFDRAAENLKRMLLKMIDVVDMSVSGAVTSFSRRDVTKAEEVLKSDDVIDAMEVDIEEECLKILALHQPSAASLRFIVATLKINNDLERIGDLACSMARRARAYRSASRASACAECDRATRWSGVAPARSARDRIHQGRGRAVDPGARYRRTCGRALAGWTRRASGQ